MTGRVEGKVAIITGAGTGIGRACFSLFAREGATVIGVSRTQANLDAALAEVKAETPGATGMVIARDLAQPESADEIVAAAVAARGDRRAGRRVRDCRPCNRPRHRRTPGAGSPPSTSVRACPTWW